MHLHCYMITLAESAEDAKSTVEDWIEEHFEREFYDYGGLEKGEEVVLLSEIRERLEAEKAEEVNRLIPEIENEIQKWKESGNRSMEGYSYVRYGNVLQESFCPDMPFFNINDWDWSLPEFVPKDCGDPESQYDWYAVKVDLHF